MTAVGIKGIHIHWPEKRQNVHVLQESGQLSEKLFTRIGVDSVLAAEEEEAPTSLGLQAAKGLLDELKQNPDEIDLVVFTCATLPEHWIWSPSAFLCHELGIRNALGFEVIQGCNSVQMAMKMLKDMMLSNEGWNKALVVSADNWEPFTTNRYGGGVIFGDCGTAALLEKGEEVSWRLEAFEAFTMGEFNTLARVENGHLGVRDSGEIRYDFADSPELNRQLKEVNLSNYKRVVDQLLTKSGWQLEDVDYLIIPSGRSDLMNAIADFLSFPKERTNIRYLAHQGDLGPGGLLADLKNIIRHNAPAPGTKILTLWAGTGITWSGTTIEV